MDSIIQFVFRPEPLFLPLFAWAYILYLVAIDILEMIEWFIEELRH